MTGDWHVRGYRAGDEHAIVDLFARAFGKPMTQAHWLWKFKARPTTIENVWLAESGARIVSQFAAIPHLFRLGSIDALGMAGVDSMTDPDYQRRGLFRTVAGHAYDTWRRAGVALVTGLPNESSWPGNEQLGMQRVGPLRWFVRPLRPDAVLAARAGLPRRPRPSRVARLWNRVWDRAADADVRIREVDAAGTVFDELWRRSSGNTRAAVVKDAAWIQWRYFACPSVRYHVLVAERSGAPVGFCGWRIENRPNGHLGLITEVSAIDMEAPVIDALVSHVSRRLAEAGAVTAGALATPGSVVASTLSRRGYRWSWGAFSFGVLPLAVPRDAGDVLDPRAWSIAGADFDVV